MNFLKKLPKTQENFRIIKNFSNILKSVQEYIKIIWYSQIEVSIGRSLKKAIVEKEKEEKEKKLFLTFWGKAKSSKKVQHVF